MRHKHPKTYKAEFNGKKVMVTVPADDESQMQRDIRDELSPHAVAAIAATVLSVNIKRGKDTDDVENECVWFATELINMLGKNQYSKLCLELGL